MRCAAFGRSAVALGMAVSRFSRQRDERRRNPVLLILTGHFLWDVPDGIIWPWRMAMPPDHRKALSGQDDASPWIDWLNRTQAGLAPRQATRLVQGATALALLAGTALAPPAQAQGAPAAPPVTVATPLARQVAEWDEHTARIEPSARVELRPRVSGQVMQVHFQDGAL